MGRCGSYGSTAGLEIGQLVTSIPILFPLSENQFGYARLLDGYGAESQRNRHRATTCWLRAEQRGNGQVKWTGYN